jgi:hypothetical protein
MNTAIDAVGLVVLLANFCLPRRVVVVGAVMVVSESSQARMGQIVYRCESTEDCSNQARVRFSPSEATAEYRGGQIEYWCPYHIAQVWGCDPIWFEEHIGGQSISRRDGDISWIAGSFSPRGSSGGEPDVDGGVS